MLSRSRIVVDNSPLSLKANMLWNSLGSFFYLACSWLTTVLVVCLSDDYSASGSLAVAMAVGNLTSTIVFFKVRPVQVGLPEREYDTSIFVGMRIVCCVSAFALSAAYMIVSVDESNYLVVLLYVGFKIIESFVDVYHAVFQRCSRLDYAGVSQIIRGILILLSFSTGLLLCGSLEVSIFLMSLSSLLVIILYDYLHVRQLDGVSPSFSKKRLLRLFTTCFPGFLACLLVQLVVSVARQDYGLLFGNEALGFYAAVATPTVLIQVFANYLYAPLYGSISDSYREGNTTWLTRVLFKVTAVVFLLLVGCCALSWFVGDGALVAIYGGSIADYSYLLYGAFGAAAMTALIYFYIDVLILIKDYMWVVATALACFIATILGLNFVISEDANSISLLIIASYCFGSLMAVTRILLKVRAIKIG